MRQLLTLVFILSLATGPFFSCSGPEYTSTIDTVASPVARIAGQLPVDDKYFKRKVVQKTTNFYEATSYKKAWLEKKGPSQRFKAFADEVKESARYGLNPDDYHLPEIEKAIDSLYDNRDRKDADISAMDIRITTAFFLFTTHMLEGRIRYAGSPEFIWKKGQPHEDDVQMLTGLDSGGDLRREIDRLHPKDPQYEQLRKAFEHYRANADRDTEKIPLAKTIKPGERSESIPLIRRKLRLTDLDADSHGGDSLLFDEELANAVTKFKRRHGLDQTATIDKETVRMMNVPLKRKAELIALNLERLRWRPHTELKDEQLIVNVPDFMLHLYRDKKKMLEMRVILGEEFNATPIFNDTLKYVVFSPTWNVPKSIFEEEFLPNLRNNAAYYSADFQFFKNGEEIDPEEVDWEDEDLKIAEYRAVQQPGNLNALGNVKFVMPNNFNIYLHDTPADRLFKRDDRALSHGCVRLEKPVELAEYLLRDQDQWSRKDIVKAMGGTEPKTVNLKKSYPVHIVYRTVWVDDEGLVHFRDDVYGHDERQLARLRKSSEFENITDVKTVDEKS